jgi:hypothetical protein
MAKTVYGGTKNNAGDPREPEQPTRTWICGDCGRTVERWRGQGDVDCECGACYNSFGQRLRDDWRSNSSWQYDDVDDMEGFERQQLSYEQHD